MWSKIKALFRPEPAAGSVPEGELQKLRLELEARDRTLAQLTADLVRQRDGAAGQVSRSVQSKIERLLSEAATPITQLITQAHLLEVEGQPVQAHDILAVSKSLVRILQAWGLAPEGAVGEHLPFDPNHHQPLRSEQVLAPGEQVVLRFVGMTYQGTVLRKAGVEKVEA